MKPSKFQRDNQTNAHINELSKTIDSARGPFIRKCTFNINTNPTITGPLPPLCLW